MPDNIFMERLQQNGRPVVLDLWAPWCIPCRAIEPAVRKLGEEHADRVDVWKVNADEHPDLARSLRVLAIPTLIAFYEGREVGRHTGAASSDILEGIFRSALSGIKPAHGGPTPLDRLLRSVAGLILILLAVAGGLSGAYLLLAGIGVVILFSAVYDRCPVYRLLTLRLGEILERKAERQHRT